MSDLRNVPLSALVAIVAGRSPFDAIRRTDEHGEWWSARELMPLLGYQRWESFQDAIYRASISAKNSGTDGDHFRGFPNVIEGGRWGQQSVQDFRLTRYGAYLVAMNGDPRKPEIAAAQSYFAIKAREAEIAPARPALPQSYADALRELAASVERAEQAQRELETAAPSAAAWDVLASADGDYSVRQAAYILNRDPAIDTGQQRLFQLLRKWRLIDIRDIPYADHARHVRLRARSYTSPSGNERTAEQVRITAAGLKYLHKRMGGTEPLSVTHPET